jgi:rare lipoprotein A
MITRPGSSRQAAWYNHQENNFDAQIGLASYYRPSKQIASGGRFRPSAMTAAHRSLPFGTRVRITRIDTGNSVEVTINDRGPFVAGRIIDLSRAAALVLGMSGRGTARVKLSVLGR